MQTSTKRKTDKPLFVVIAELDGYITAQLVHDDKTQHSEALVIRESADKCTELQIWARAGVPCFDLRGSEYWVLPLFLGRFLYEYSCYRMTTAQLIQAMRNSRVPEYQAV